jgi:hypothetical protein
VVKNTNSKRESQGKFAKDARKQPGEGWIVQVSLPDSDIASIKMPHLKMLLVLERICRDKSYAWASNAFIAGRCGLGERQVRRILQEMELEGFVYRYVADAGLRGSGRDGIFLLRRLDSDRPVEDTVPTPESIQRLWQAGGRASAADTESAAIPADDRQETRSKMSGGGGQKCPGGAVKNVRRNKNTLNKDEMEISPPVYPSSPPCDPREVVANRMSIDAEREMPINRQEHQGTCPLKAPMNLDSIPFPGRPASSDLDRLADRAAVVFGDRAMKLRTQVETIAFQVGLENLWAALAKAELEESTPKSLTGLLISFARGFRDSGIPDWVGEQLAKPPRPIGSGPLPSQTRPVTYFRAEDHPVPRDPDKVNLSSLEMVHRLIREQAAAKRKKESVDA